VDLTDLTRVSVEEREFDKLRLLEGDILFVRTNGNPHNIGRSAVFASEDIQCLGVEPSEVIFASYLIRARLNQAVMMPRFVQLYLQSPSGRAELLSHCKTSAGQFNISTAGLGAISIPAPPLDVQERLVGETNARFDAASKVRDMVQDQLADLNRTPTILLRAAFQGQL
jgi:type I restriction enzyme S subunit